MTTEKFNSAASFRTGYDHWEYLLVAYPDTTVHEKLWDEKKVLQGAYGSAAGAPASFITLASFQAKEALEETLSRWIQNICNLHPGFTATLNNFSGFPPHTIYLRVQDPQPFLKLSNALKMLDSFMQSNDGPPLSICTKPHLPIAAGLPEPLYQTLMPYYAGREFHASFAVEKLVLLKRDHLMHYDIINTFILAPAVSPS